MNQDNTEKDSINKAAETYYANFSKSFLEELNSGIYFETEWPLVEGKIREGNPIDDNHLILDAQALEELNSDYEYVSLFEAALLIGSRVNSLHPSCLVSEWKMFADAVLAEEIYPRDPTTYIPYNKGDHSKSVDMSWCLNMEEVVKFAILKGYPSEIFNDLLEVPREKLPTAIEGYAIYKGCPDALVTDIAPDIVASIRKQSEEDRKKSKDADIEAKKPLDPREKNTLLTIIYALCENAGISPNDKDLPGQLQPITNTLGRKISERIIKQHLNKAFDLLGK